MSSSVPRSRTAMTPTGGKFQPPGAPVSAVKYSGRRGVSTPRSALKNPGLGKCANPVPKPKLTAQQQLEIIQKIESGNFTKGKGLNQFYEEIAAKESKPKCRQNLYSTFAFADPVATSTRNYGNGMSGSVESLSMSSSMISSAPSTADTEVASVGTGVGGGEILVEGYVVPGYIQAFNELLASKENLYRSLQDLVELKCKTEFARLLPQEKMETFLKSLKRVQRIIQTFLDGNASDSMQLFLPTPSRKGPEPPVIHCDVENHAEFIQSFDRFREILLRLETFLEQESKDFKLDEKMQSFDEMVSKLEDVIKSQEQHALSVKELARKIDIMNQDSPCGGSGTDAFEDASP